MIDAAFEGLEPVVGTRSACVAVGRPTASHYRRLRPPVQGPPRPRPAPSNALTPKRAGDGAGGARLGALRGPGTRPGVGDAARRGDLPRVGVHDVPDLRADGDGAVRERRRQATHPPRTIPELVASGPCEVWPHDATALRGPSRGVWYRLFLMLDLSGRYCPGWTVVPHERGDLVADWIAGLVALHGPAEPGALTIHADRGSAMTSKPVSQLLADLRIGRTHSRPHVSNDNPYSESALRTLKYAPDFPASFGSVQDARAYVGPFLDFHDHEHRHSGIGYHTPASIHLGARRPGAAGPRPRRRLRRASRAVRQQATGAAATAGTRLGQPADGGRSRELSHTEWLIRLDRFRCGAPAKE